MVKPVGFYQFLFLIRRAQLLQIYVLTLILTFYKTFIFRPALPPCNLSPPPLSLPRLRHVPLHFHPSPVPT